MLSSKNIADGCARGQRGQHLHTVQPESPAHASDTDLDEVLSHVMPDRQPYAEEYLQGRTPGIMQRYAPDAKTSDVEGWVESDETVERLRKFREEFPYG